MKRTIRIALALGLIAAVFMAMYAEPAGSDEFAVEEGSLHPCTVHANLLDTSEYCAEELGPAWERYANSVWEWERVILDAISTLPHGFSELDWNYRLPDDLSELDWAYVEPIGFSEEDWAYIWPDGIGELDWANVQGGMFCDLSLPAPSWPEGGDRMSMDRFNTFVICQLIYNIWFLRNNMWMLGTSSTYPPELLQELRFAYAALLAAKLAMDSAWNELVSTNRTCNGLTDRISEAERECNLTRAYMSVTDRLRDVQEQKPMPRFDRALLEQMQNPMGSGANQGGVEGHLEIPVATSEQAQPSQSGEGQVAMPETNTPTVTPPRARRFNKPPQRSTPSAEAQPQSTPAATGQTMQVQQESTSPGSSGVGYTHMPIPQRAGQAGPVLAPQKSLRAIPPKMPMRVLPDRSIKK